MILVEAATSWTYNSPLSYGKKKFQMAKFVFDRALEPAVHVVCWNRNEFFFKEGED